MACARLTEFDSGLPRNSISARMAGRSRWRNTSVAPGATPPNCPAGNRSLARAAAAGRDARNMGAVTGDVGAGVHRLVPHHVKRTAGLQSAVDVVSRILDAVAVFAGEISPPLAV